MNYEVIPSEGSHRGSPSDYVFSEAIQRIQLNLEQQIVAADVAAD